MFLSLAKRLNSYHILLFEVVEEIASPNRLVVDSDGVVEEDVVPAFFQIDGFAGHVGSIEVVTQKGINVFYVEKHGDAHAHNFVAFEFL